MRSRASGLAAFPHVPPRTCAPLRFDHGLKIAAVVKSNRARRHEWKSLCSCAPVGPALFSGFGGGELREPVGIPFLGPFPTG